MFFYGGLEALVGAPNAQVLETMEIEHCESADSDKKFRTGNYRVTTTPEIE